MSTAGQNEGRGPLKKPLTRKRCECPEAKNGVIVNVKTKQPFTWDDPCVEYGPPVAYNEQAYIEARMAVKDFRHYCL
jgi:hypothetical protein